MEALMTFGEFFGVFMLAFAVIWCLAWVAEKLFNAIGGAYGERVGTLAAIVTLSVVGAACLTLIKFVFEGFK